MSLSDLLLLLSLLHCILLPKKVKVLRPSSFPIINLLWVDLIQSPDAKHHVYAGDSHIYSSCPISLLSSWLFIQLPIDMATWLFNRHSNVFFPKTNTWSPPFNTSTSSLPHLSAWPQYSLNFYTFIPSASTFISTFNVYQVAVTSPPCHQPLSWTPTNVFIFSSCFPSFFYSQFYTEMV